jgi:hypothetical protein
MTPPHFSIPVVHVILSKVPLCSSGTELYAVYRKACSKRDTEPTFYSSETTYLHCNGLVLCCMVSQFLYYRRRSFEFLFRIKKSIPSSIGKVHYLVRVTCYPTTIIRSNDCILCWNDDRASRCAIVLHTCNS